MENEPKIIHLNCYDEAEKDEDYLPIDNDFNSLDHEFVLWSEDVPVLSVNIKYVHHKEVDRLVKEAVKVDLQVASEKALNVGKLSSVIFSYNQKLWSIIKQSDNEQEIKQAEWAQDMLFKELVGLGEIFEI